MHAKELYPERVEVSSARPSNRLVVENYAGRVIIRAARDNFSPRAKSCFVRYLAAEGYIPEEYQAFTGHRTDDSCTVQWTVANPGEELVETCRRNAPRQVLWVWLVAAWLWLGLMGLAFLRVLG